eukprot:gene13484-28582_t
MADILSFTDYGRCPECGCIGPNPGYNSLSHNEIKIEMCNISTYWKASNDLKSITRKFTCRNWQACINFINAASELAESDNVQHHPDIHLTKYRDIELILHTHAAHGLTKYDFCLAKELDKVTIDYSPKWLLKNPQPLRISAVVAVTPSWGIGKNGTLPWVAAGTRLPSDMAYFKKMTQETLDPSKINAVIMGRKTYEGIPVKYRPLVNRLNIVLTRDDNWSIPDGIIRHNSLQSALQQLSSDLQYYNKIEKAVIIGGIELFEESIFHPFCTEYHVTKIHTEFEYDTKLTDKTIAFLQSTDPILCSDIQMENEVEYSFCVYNPSISSIVS